MKKTLRALTLILVLCLLAGGAAFADEADTDHDGYVLGTWKPSAMVMDGQRTPLPESMPIEFNADHSGSFDFLGALYSFTWYYKGMNETSYVYELILKAPDGQVFVQNFVYFHNYEALTGTGCFMLGEGSYILYDR